MKTKIKREYNNAVARICKKRLYLNTNINITDNTRIEIENCKRIIEYNDIFIRLKTSTVTVQIWGENLSVSDYNRAGVVIDGKITSVEFE
jgi:sporulation protein YqfC